jgi:hypothetical protein
MAQERWRSSIRSLELMELMGGRLNRLPGGREAPGGTGISWSKQCERRGEHVRLPNGRAPRHEYMDSMNVMLQ